MKNIFYFIAALFSLSAVGQVVPLNVQQASGTYTDNSIVLRSGTGNKVKNTPNLTYVTENSALNLFQLDPSFGGTGINFVMGRTSEAFRINASSGVTNFTTVDGASLRFAPSGGQVAEFSYNSGTGARLSAFTGDVTTSGSVTSSFFFGDYFTTDPGGPSVGAVRLQNADLIAWEANPAGTDLTLGVNTSNVLATNAPFSAPTIASTISTGTAPFTVASTTLVSNLHAATADASTTTTTATNATNTAVTDDTSTNATMYPTWVTTTTGNLPQKLSSTKLTFNPSTATLTVANLAGNASTATTATTATSATTATTATNANNGATVASSSNASFFPLFAASSSNGNQPFNLGTGLTFNPSTNNLSTTTFTGALTGNASTATSATSATTATNATNTAVTDDTTTNATMFPTWVTTATGNLPQKLSSTKLTFNPSTGTLASTVGNFGSLTGIASVTGTTGNMTITSGVGNSRTMILQTTTSGGTATTALTLNADQSATFANAINATSPSFTTSLVTPSTTFALLNTTATTVNAFGGASTALNMGNASGSTTMLGIIGLDGATPSSSTAAIFPAGTTGVSSLRIPHGSAPTSPVNGDFWTTSAGGLFARINGATINYGSANISGLTTTAFVTANGATGVQTPSATSTLDSSGNAVFAGTATATQFIGSGTTPAAVSLIAGSGSIPALTANSAGWAAPATGGTAYLIKPPATITGGVMVLAAPATADGVNESALSSVAPSTSGNVLTSNGTTWVSSAATGSVANPSATIGLSAVNGSATSAVRSDGAPALSQAIVPTWTGIHTFTPAARSSGAASYFVLTTPADTNQTLSTEAIGANFTAATRQWATGALTTQRERVFAAPTYGFVGASTLTTAINVDIADPIQGTNATLTNSYGLRVNNQQVTGTLTANTGTNKIGPLVDSVDGTTPLNNISQTVASGTAYTLTATSAAVTFGTTSPIVTLPNAGTYWISADIQYSYVGATFAANRQFDEKLRRTNNTPADVTGSAFSEFIPTLTTISDAGPHAHIGPFLYTTALTTDTIQVFADVSVLPTAGSVTVSSCTIVAMRAF